MDPRITADQLDDLTSLLRDKLLRYGLDRSHFDLALKEAVDELCEMKAASPVFSSDDEQSSIEKRGVDSLGRILVEYCFFEGNENQKIWPENSEQDQTARKVFMEDWIPRPVMRYFLASVRGSVEGLDSFEADSMLSLHSDTSHTKYIEAVTELIDEYKGPFGEGESSIDWNAVYADPRCREIALDLVRDIRLRLTQLGIEQYLVMLDDLRTKDQDASGSNAMHRSLSLEDIRLIDDSLAAAEARLTDNK